MNNKVLYTLEYNKIIEKLKGFAVSEMGKKLAEELKPTNNIDDILQAQKETSEAVSMILKKGSLPLGGLKNIQPYLKRVSIGGSLSIQELFHICDFLYISRKAKNYAKNESKNDIFEVLEPLFELIEPVNELERDISKCIISDTEIADEASGTLKDIRRGIKLQMKKLKTNSHR